MFAEARSGADVGATGDEVLTMAEGARSGAVRSGTAGAGVAQATASDASASNQTDGGLLAMKRAAVRIGALNVASIINLSVAVTLRPLRLCVSPFFQPFAIFSDAKKYAYDNM